MVSRTPTSPLIIEAMNRVKERRAHQYPSDQYGIDTTIEDDILERIIVAVLDAPRRRPRRRGLDTGHCLTCGFPIPLNDSVCDQHL